MKSNPKQPTFAAVTTVIMLFVFVGMLSMSFMNNSQDDKKKKPWVVPEKSKAMKNPVKADATSQIGRAHV